MDAGGNEYDGDGIDLVRLVRIIDETADRFGEAVSSYDSKPAEVEEQEEKGE